MLIADLAILEVYGESVIGKFRSSASNFASLLFAQDYGKDAVVHAVVAKDVCERRRDDDAKAKILQGPDCVLQKYEFSRSS